MELINSNNDFTLEYSEEKDRYFVCDCLGFALTNLHLSFEEAKSLYDALDFCDCDVFSYNETEIQIVIKEVRKERRCERELNMRLMDLFIGE